MPFRIFEIDKSSEHFRQVITKATFVVQFEYSIVCLLNALLKTIVTLIFAQILLYLDRQVMQVLLKIESSKFGLYLSY